MFKNIRFLLIPMTFTLAIHCANFGGNNNGVACTEIAAAGLDVGVNHSVTGASVCGATVTATEGSYSETLFENACRYTGAYERPGTYTITVSKAGFTTTQKANVVVVMGTGECPHVVQTTVNISLVPAQ